MTVWQSRGCQSDGQLPVRLEREIRSPLRNANRNHVEDEGLHRRDVDRHRLTPCIKLNGVAQTTESAAQREPNRSQEYLVLAVRDILQRRAIFVAIGA